MAPAVNFALNKILSKKNKLYCGQEQGVEWGGGNGRVGVYSERQWINNDCLCRGSRT